mgnify:CR=1 FL=1
MAPSVRCLCVILLVLSPALAFATRCEIGGVEVNTDNGATTAGKTGLLKCYRPDGSLWREQELRDGEYIGLDKRYDEDGSVHERRINAQGNTQGVAREFHPNGKLKSEGEYDNGRPVGVTRSYFPDGHVQALRYYEKAGTSAAVTLEYNADGSLKDLRCGKRSFLAEDKTPCGFVGESTVELHDMKGRLVERRVYRQGEVQRIEQFGRDGRLAASVETTAQGRIERTYHPDGKPAQEVVIRDGWKVSTTEWYMNGKVRSRTTREPVEREARTVVDQYRDDGTPAYHEESIGERRVQSRKFAAGGVLEEEADYAPEGYLATRRKYAPDGRVVAEESFYPDGSHRAGPRIGGAP